MENNNISLESFSLEQLRFIRNAALTFEDKKSFVECISNAITVNSRKQWEEKTKLSYNERVNFNLEPYNRLISDTERNLLIENGINTMHDLINADLSNVVDKDGNHLSTPQKEYLEWAKVAYNFSDLEAKDKAQKVMHK